MARILNLTGSDIIIADKYRIIEKIGSGSFGDVYRAKNIKCDEEVAVKVEPEGNKYLLAEYNLYKDLSGGGGYPRVHCYSKEKEFNALVMDLLGPSLADLFDICKRRFTVNTVAMLAEQMIDRVEYMHKKSYIHRDIKPENFLIGKGARSKQVFLIDFGLAKKFDANANMQFSTKQNSTVTGTARYASVLVHFGFEHSRRDDLEALGYTWLYMIRGSLPWQEIKASTTQQTYEKLYTLIDNLCEGFPVQFSQYFKYCRKLDYRATPNYSELKNMFRSLQEKNSIYDWEKITSCEKENKKHHTADHGDCVSDTALSAKKKCEKRKLQERHTSNDDKILMLKKSRANASKDPSATKQ